jgi:tetratricopeptide (TPR) repeat protein
VAIDRATTLRNAEKLVRQGKVDAAIAEYLRVVEDHPGDWNTANLLGDLYGRVGKSDKAVEQFVRIADSLYEQGFLPKAAALYKKILKLKSDHEHALLQAGEIAAQQGFYADARTHLGAVLEYRRARGDARGSAEVRVRLGSLDATDFDGRIAAANARVEIGDVAAAVRDLTDIASALIEKERRAEAITVLRQAAALAPGDEAIRARLLDVSLAMAEAHFRSGPVDQGLAIVTDLIEEDPSRLAQIVTLACKVAADVPDAGFAAIEIAVSKSAARNDWTAAAAALQEFVASFPGHVPALLRLVEICVDADLDAALPKVQEQLADAYLAAGQAAEARFIAEDLVSREPSEQANIDRLRRALDLLGEPNPDAIIADRIGGPSPLTADLDAAELTSPEFTTRAIETPPAPAPPVADPSPEPAAPAVPHGEPDHPAAAEPISVDAAEKSHEPSPAPPSPPSPGNNRQADRSNLFELSANAVDIESILGGFDPRPANNKTKGQDSESAEVDLSIVLDDIKRPPPMTPLPPRGDHAPRTPPAIEGADIEGVFSQLRDEASRRSAIEAAEQEFRRGLALQQAGDVDGCIAALRSASKAPKLRFATASLLARIFRERGQTAEALHWCESAVQAPAPTPNDYHALLFELAELLEAEGEIVRALAVCLELQADAGDYRDVAARVDRLAKVQARG